MDERRVADLIRAELRDILNIEERRVREAIKRAALRIANEAMQDQRAAARTASIAGYAVTRGRTRL